MQTTSLRRKKCSTGFATGRIRQRRDGRSLWPMLRFRSQFVRRLEPEHAWKLGIGDNKSEKGAAAEPVTHRGGEDDPAGPAGVSRGGTTLPPRGDGGRKRR